MCHFHVVHFLEPVADLTEMSHQFKLGERFPSFFALPEFHIQTVNISVTAITKLVNNEELPVSLETFLDIL